MAFGLDDLIVPAVSGALSLLGGQQRNDAQAAQAAQANAFSAQQYATRYQTTVKDMEAAGLNPMLAYSQGAGTAPSGQQGQMSDAVTPAVQSFTQSRVASAQVANIEADTANKQASADLIQGQAAQAWASAGQSNAQTGLISATVDKTKQEIANLSTDNEKAKATIDNLRAEYQNLVKQGWNLTEVGNQLRATVAKIQSEIPQIQMQTLLTEANNTLANFDIKAASDMGNAGRTLGQLKPFFDLLTSILRASRR